MSEAVRKVLLVEDEPGIQLAIRGLLKREGYAIQVASTGAQAIGAIDSESFDVILTDLSLPDGVTGLDVARHVAGKRPGTPVVLITAYGSDSIEEEAGRAGVFDYVPKPFSNDEVREVVRRALEVRQGAPR